MIEDGLFLALGFCIAVVLALALLPLLWARALRLTKQRLELLVPWSKSEIDAERDGLRALAAVEQRRLEQDMERGRALLAGREVELGQRTVSLVQAELDREALRDECHALRSELLEQSRARLDAEGQGFAAEKALHDADRRIETDAVAATAQLARYERLANLAEERRGTIAALETRVAGLLANVEDRDDALLRSDAALAQVRTAHEALAAEHEGLAVSHALLQGAHDGAQRALAQERSRASEREQRLNGRAAALAAAETRITEQDASMKHQDERHEALKMRFDALTAELAARKPDEREGVDRDDRLRAAIVAAGNDALHLLAARDRDDVAPLAATELVRTRP